MDAVAKSKGKLNAAFLAQRSGMAVSPNIKNAVFRQDMGDVLLDMMRNKAVNALIKRTEESLSPVDKFVAGCDIWDDIKAVKNRGCVLWLPKEDDTGSQYPTWDVEGAKYGQKIPVHNLSLLLGDEQVTRLKESSPIFREREILVLKYWKSESMVRLHLLLWRLQGYLAAP